MKYLIARKEHSLSDLFRARKSHQSCTGIAISGKKKFLKKGKRKRLYEDQPNMPLQAGQFFFLNYSNLSQQLAT